MRFETGFLPSETHPGEGEGIRQVDTFTDIGPEGLESVVLTSVMHEDRENTLEHVHIAAQQVTSEMIRFVADNLPNMVGVATKVNLMSLVHSGAHGLPAPPEPGSAEDHAITMAYAATAQRRVAATGTQGQELAAIAAVYNAAVADERPPLRAVMRKFHLAKATASRRIRKAKNIGLIPDVDNSTRGAS